MFQNWPHPTIVGFFMAWICFRSDVQSVSFIVSNYTRFMVSSKKKQWIFSVCIILSFQLPQIISLILTKLPSFICFDLLFPSLWALQCSKHRLDCSDVFHAISSPFKRFDETDVCWTRSNLPDTYVCICHTIHRQTYCIVYTQRGALALTEIKMSLNNDVSLVEASFWMFSTNLSTCHI